MQISTSIKGIQKDVNDFQKDDQTYSYVLNGTVEHYSESQPFPYIGNTPSNIKCLEFNTDEKLIGSKYIPELDTTILAVYNSKTNESKFLRLNYVNINLQKGNSWLKKCDCVKLIPIPDQELQCQVEELFSTTCFKWSGEYPVSIVHKITDCTFNLYFANGYDEDRYIYFNKDWSVENSFKYNDSYDDCNPNYIDLVDCSRTSWNPKVDYPCLEPFVISDGNKRPGQYGYMFAYSTNRGVPLTPFKNLTGGISIFNDSKLESNKGVKINVQGITKNSRYRYYVLTSIQTVNGLTSYKQLGPFPISQESVLDLDNEGLDISINDINSPSVFYKHSQQLTLSNNILFKKSLTEFDKFNLQKIFNKVRVKWVTTTLKEGDYKKPEIAQNFKSFLRDEVYALAIELVLDNTEQGPLFPLIGREATDFDNELVNNLDANSYSDVCDDTDKKRWQVYNTATKTLISPINYNDCCSGSIYEEGEFAYWESSKNYPNVPEVWGDLCGKPIRHFKFPDNLITSHFSCGTNENYIHPLGVKIVDDISVLLDQAVLDGTLTQEQRNRITGYRLLRSNRTGNKSVVAKGLLYHVWSYREDNRDINFINKECQTIGQTYYYPNYPFDDLHDDPFLMRNADLYDTEEPKHPQFENYNRQSFTNTGRYTFHSPDTHFYTPDLGNYLKLEGLVTGKSEGFFNIAEEQAEYKLPKRKQLNLTLSLGKWMASLQPDPVQEQVQQLGTNLGSGILGSIGGAVGSLIPGGSGISSTVGSALGGLLGSMIGKSFYNNNSLLQFVSAAYKSGIIQTQVESFLNLFKLLSNYEQHHYQFQAVGTYNCFTPLENNTGEKIRVLEDSRYLDSGKFNINPDTYFNNLHRESSVYLQVNENLPTPSLVDNSRYLISDNTIPTQKTVTETYECYQYEIKIHNENNDLLNYITYGVYGEYCEKKLSIFQNFPSKKACT